jgi:hypothetical protein
MKFCKKHNIEYKNSRCLVCTYIYHKTRRENAKKIQKSCKIHNNKFYGLRCKICNVISSTKCYKNKKDIIKLCKLHNINFKIRCLECIKFAAKKNRICKHHNIEFKKVCPICRDIIREKYKNKRNADVKNKLQTDTCFKLRLYVPAAIRTAIKRNGFKKNGNSILKFLPYSIEDLKNHIEKQFEPWMNWNNWRKYNPKTWDDFDQATWTWQIDHIIPQSLFKYSSMEDEEFKRCWTLENLRPYNSKLNIIEGSNRFRHKGIRYV